MVCSPSSSSGAGRRSRSPRSASSSRTAPAPWCWLPGARSRSPSRSPSCEALGATRVETVAFDAAATDTHEAFVDDVFERYGDLDLVVLAFGVLGDQEEAERDGAAAAEIARVNYLGAVSVTIPVANAPPGPGPRHDRGALVGRRRAGPPLELRLRLVEGGARRVLPGSGRQPHRHGRPRDDRPPRLRAHEDDRRPRRGTARDHARSRRRRDRAWARAWDRGDLGASATALRDVGTAPPPPRGVPQAPSREDRRRVRLRQDDLEPRQRRPVPRRGGRTGCARRRTRERGSRPRPRPAQRREGAPRPTSPGRSRRRRRATDRRRVRRRRARASPARRRGRTSRVAPRCRAPARVRLRIVRVLPPTGRATSRASTRCSPPSSRWTPTGGSPASSSGPTCAARRRSSRLDAWLADEPATVWAYGDSSGDRELLACADHPARVTRERLRAEPDGVEGP